MHNTTRKKLRALWIIPPIALGIAIMGNLVGNKKPPVKIEQQEIARTVRTISVPEVDLRPVAEGYGVVQPAKLWRAVAQVSGRIIEMHPRLRDGEIIPAGNVLFRIDPINYQLALEQLKAELAELAVQEKNTETLLQIEQRNLQLAERESTRLQKLVAEGNISHSRADEAERAMLNSRTAVQSLRNTLALIPSQRRVIEAKRAQAERDLENTTIQAPFNLRIANLTVETEQYISAGQTLFEGDGVDRVEVVAQVAISSLAHLFAEHGTTPPSQQELTEGLAKYAELKPTIEMDMGDQFAHWSAEFVRFSDRIDSETRTIGVVVALDNPLQQIIPGQRPPLSKGMFVRVRLEGRIQPARTIIPRTALRNGQVLLLTSQQRLQHQAVTISYHQGDISVVESGLSAGDQLIVTDLIPAVDGMLLKPQTDTTIEQQLKAAGAAS